jgi:hypothetical protein
MEAAHQETPVLPQVQAIFKSLTTNHMHKIPVKHLPSDYSKTECSMYACNEEATKDGDTFCVYHFNRLIADQEQRWGEERLPEEQD